jgi:signal peptide peptidase SppA
LVSTSQFGASHEILALAPGYAPLAPEAAAARFGRGEVASYYGFDRQVELVQLLGLIDKRVAVGCRQEINRAAADERVREIVLLVDSPGGWLPGVDDLSQAVFAAAQRKPVTAFIEDTGASAAYWAIAGATKIYANTTATVGSIGVYQRLVDTSRAMDREGIEVIVLRAGARKGGYVNGAKILPEFIQEVQQDIDAVHRIFIARVAKGRRMSVGALQEIADGRVFMGVAAQAAGLIDGIGVFEDVLRQALGRAPDRFIALKAYDAVAKYEELSASVTGDDQLRWIKMREAYPELTAKADEFRAAQEKKRQEEYERDRLLKRGL